MSIFDDIGKFLDDAFGVSSKQNPLHGLKKGMPLRTGGSIDQDPFNSVNAYQSPITGIGNISDETPKIWGLSKDQSYSDLATIIQSRERGFTVVDVIPFNCDATNFFPLPNLNALHEKIGNQGDEFANTGGTGGNFNSWRSVQIPVVGNFLQIKFLPARVNSFSSSQDSEVGPSVGNPNSTAYRKEVNTYETKFFNSQFRTNRPIDNSNRIILVQFDDSNAPLINCEHGETFKVQFTSVILTFRVNTPRFTIIIGNNAEIDTHNDGRAVNSDLATGPGTGLWENPLRHATPFCITDEDQVPTNGFSQLASGASQLFTLFQTQSALIGNVGNFDAFGAMVGWITGINLAVEGNGGAATVCTGALYIFVTSQDDNGTSKLIASVPFIIPMTTTVGVTQNFNIQYGTPRRFVLSPAKGQGARPTLNAKITVSNIGAALLNYKFSIEGYTYGLWTGSGLKAAKNFNYIMDAVVSDPFPLDLFTPASPGPS